MRINSSCVNGGFLRSSFHGKVAVEMSLRNASSPRTSILVRRNGRRGRIKEKQRFESRSGRKVGLKWSLAPWRTDPFKSMLVKQVTAEEGTIEVTVLNIRFEARVEPCPCQGYFCCNKKATSQACETQNLLATHAIPSLLWIA